MMTKLNLTNFALLAATAAFLFAPGKAHANCYITAASAMPYSVPAAGMVSAVTISAPAGCRWNFNNHGVSWVRILSASSGSGSAVVYFQVLPNSTGRARSGAFGPEGLPPVYTNNIGARSGPTLLYPGSTGFTITMTQAAH